MSSHFFTTKLAESGNYVIDELSKLNNNIWPSSELCSLFDTPVLPTNFEFPPQQAHDDVDIVLSFRSIWFIRRCDFIVFNDWIHSLFSLVTRNTKHYCVSKGRIAAESNCENPPQLCMCAMRLSDLTAVCWSSSFVREFKYHWSLARFALHSTEPLNTILSSQMLVSDEWSGALFTGFRRAMRQYDEFHTQRGQNNNTVHITTGSLDVD